ncbi:MAG: hypothetical protein J2O47_05720, partial [Acidimicrobiaceae bacterium]|nr:hypothetical protein [Acidimicrobiaceae bacterium]
VRWLPHARSDIPGTAPVRVGNDDDSREQRLKELLALLDARRSASRDTTLFSPSVVVVFDGVRQLRTMPGVPRLLREGPAVGIYAIGLDRDPARLAGEGRAEVVFDPNGLSTTIRVDGRDPLEGVLADLVSPEWCERIARRMAPVRDAGGTDGGAALPSSVRFVDLVGVDLDDPAPVVARWRGGGRTTLAPVGVSIEGTFALDLQRDGPHALVAGTTGSGKSEFLQTLVASLALANRPDAIQFVLVDYKGASAFADCAELPHTVGMVTNLDGRETQRALASLEAELHRREACLHELRAADVNTAWENDPRRAGEMGLARLVLVIDEFAELVHELPDFVTGLIRIARVGRSLGVHLILATQRPSGVVSAEMRANTGLRVALRMEDPSDSREVLEAASAAGISRSTPGRAYARTGGGARIVAFQSARVAGRRRGAVASLPPPQVLPLPWSQLGFPVAFRGVKAGDTGQATDLHALVELVAKAAEEVGVGRGRSPWLEPLPDQLGLASLVDRDPEGEKRRRRDPGRWVVLGLSDLPAEQRQVVAEVDLESDGGLLVFGSGGSGKTTLLRTIATGLCTQGTPEQVRVYVLDFAGRSLAQLGDLPHVAGVATGDDLERVTRILTVLRRELERRRRLLAEARVESVSALRAQARVADIGRLVLLLDGYAGFHSTFEAGTLYPWVLQLVQLIAEGRQVGIHVVVTNNRLLGMPAAMTSAISARLVMRMATVEELISLGVPREAAAGPGLGEGRCFLGASIETQIATVSEDPSGVAQADGVADLARRLLASGVSPAPELPSLPSKVSLGGEACHPLHFALGLADLTLDTVEVDLTYANFVVTGPPLSGRSTALATAVAGIRAGTPGVRFVGIGSLTSPLAREDFWDLAGFGRAHQSTALAQAAELVAGYEGEEVRVVLVIDSLEDVDAMELNIHLEPLVRSDAVRVLAACDSGTLERAYSGWMTQLKRNRTVLVLQPASVADVEEQTRARP